MTDNKVEPIPAEVWRVASVVVFGAFMGTLDTSLVNVGLKTIGAELDSSLDTVQWVGSAYLLAMAVSLPLCGWLGRRVGVTQLWIGAVAAFTVVSGMCALAPSAGALIALRVAQGLAAGLLIPAGQTIIGRIAGPHRLGRVMSTVGIAVVVGPAIGPTVGGVMLAHSSWQWLFLMNIPFGMVAVVLGLRLLPRTAGVVTDPLDVVGFVLVAAGLSATVYAIGQFGARADITAVSVWLPLASGVAALALFVVRSIRRARPLLNLRLFTSRTFAAASVAVVFTGASLFGAMLLLPLYFQLLRGESLIATGLSLFAFGLGGIVALPLGGRLTDRYGGGIVAVGGSTIMVATTAPFAFLGAAANPVLVQGLLFTYGLAIALSAMPVVTAAYATVRPEQIPDAASIVNILQRVGGSVGAAVFAVLLARGTAGGRSVESAFEHTFLCLTAACAVALAAALFLWRAQRARSNIAVGQAIPARAADAARIR